MPGRTSLAVDHSHRLFYAGLAQKLRGFLGRRGVNIETGTPFKASSFGQLGHELDVPMVVIIAGILHRRGMNDEIVWRIIEHSVSLG